MDDLIRTFVFKFAFVDQLEEIKQPILDDLKRFNQIFDETLHHSNPLLNIIFEHIRTRKGKLMRPTLLFLVAREFGVPVEATYLSAVMLELLHTASLVHDDIVDESDERRGQASVNAVYGNKEAVLVGDFLLSSSLEKASETRNLRIVDHISSLGKQLSSGEILQLSKSQMNDFTEQSYYDIIRLKTAVLFASTAEVAAISVGASESDIKRMYEFGDNLGICFQIRDDIFDYFDNSKIGKPTGNDLLEGKLTLPVLYALNSSHDKAMMSLAAKIKEGSGSKEDVATLVDFTKSNGGIEYAENCMMNFSNRALNLISDFKQESIRHSLESYIAFVIQRNI